MKLTPEQKLGVISQSPIFWILENNLLNENQQPIEYVKHRFLIDPTVDLSPDQVVRKSAQVGFSVAAILKSLWLARYMKMNVGYVLPSQNIVKDFVNPKVDPIIQSNPVVQQLVSRDSVTLKQISDRFIYFRGAFSEREAIAISLDLLIMDELDRMPDMSVVSIYDSRLQASDYGWRWRFSNPSQIGFGVDQLFQDSDQMHWFVKCPYCNHRSFMDWAKTQGLSGAEANHYVEQELQIYACGKCGKELSDKDRQNGEWIAKYPSRHRRGYWISQLIAPWVSAKKVVGQYNDSPIDFFYNFVLGKAYTPSDLVVNREAILRACVPSIIPKVAVAIGVDQNVNQQIWVAGTPQGVFAHGKATSWEEIERLKLMWNAVVVADPAPYPTGPKLLAQKYNDFHLCYFKEMKGTEILQWDKDSKVFADRTRLLDLVASEVTEARLLFRERPYELEDYIADWANLYRTTVEKPDGSSRSVWLKKENKESDFSLATAYMRIGLSRVMTMGASRFIEAYNLPEAKKSFSVNSEGKLETDLSSVVKQTLDEMD